MLERHPMGMEVRRRNLDTIIDCRMRHPQALVDSAPGHQERPKPPSGGFLLPKIINPWH
jgi:hypothetical protein